MASTASFSQVAQTGDRNWASTDQIEDGGLAFEIKNVWQVKPGDTLILSKVQARL